MLLDNIQLNNTGTPFIPNTRQMMLDSLRQTNRSLYDQAIDSLINLIHNEKYQIGDKLPTEHQLSTELGISRTTLREAISYLERQGIVSRRHGIGTFVSIPSQQSLRGGLDELVSLKALATKVDLKYERLLWEISRAQASPETAAALLIDKDTELTRVRMVISVRDRIFAYLDSYLADDLLDCDNLQAYQEGSLLDYLLEKRMIDVSHTYSDIHAVVADRNIAETMSIEVGSPLLHLVEIYKALEGKPVVHTYNYFGTDVLNFYIIRRVVPISVFDRRLPNDTD